MEAACSLLLHFHPDKNSNRYLEESKQLNAIKAEFAKNLKNAEHLKDLQSKIIPNSKAKRIFYACLGCLLLKCFATAILAHFLYLKINPEASVKPFFFTAQTSSDWM